MTEFEKVEMSELEEDGVMAASDLKTSSSMTKSDYAQVIFHDIAETYPTDVAISCRYTVTVGHEPCARDWVGLYKVGWASHKDYVYFDWAPLSGEEEAGKDVDNDITFKENILPKDDGEFYQFCYVTGSGQIKGASTPFQFRRPSAEEFVEIEDVDNDIMVIRSKTAVLQENLDAALKEKSDLLKEKQMLDVERESLLDKLMYFERNLKESREDGENMKKTIREYKDKVCTLENESNDMDLVHDALREKITMLIQEKDDILKRLEDNEGYIKSLQDKIKVLINEKDALTGKNKMLEEEKELFKTHFTSSESTIQCYVTEIDNLKKMTSNMEDHSCNQQGQITTMAAELNEQKLKINRQQSITHSDQNHIEELNEKLRNTEDKLSAAEQCKLLVNDELNVLQLAYTKLSDDLEESKSDAHTLKMQLSMLEESSRSTKDKMEEEIAALHEAIAEKSQEKERIAMELDTLRQKVEESEQQEVDEKQCSMFHLQMAQQSLKERYSKMKVEKDNLKKELVEMVEHKQSWESKEIDLQQEVEELKKRLAMGQENYQEKYIEVKKLKYDLKKLQKSVRDSPEKKLSTSEMATETKSTIQTDVSTVTANLHKSDVSTVTVATKNTDVGTGPAPKSDAETATVQTINMDVGTVTFTKSDAGTTTVQTLNTDVGTATATRSDAETATVQTLNADAGTDAITTKNTDVGTATALRLDVGTATVAASNADVATTTISKSDVGTATLSAENANVGTATVATIIMDVGTTTCRPKTDVSTTTTPRKQVFTGQTGIQTEPAEERLESIADLTNTELQAQLQDLGHELEQRSLKKQKYKIMYQEEKAKNSFLQRHYFDELRKKDQAVAELERKMEDENDKYTDFIMKLEETIVDQQEKLDRLKASAKKPCYPPQESPTVELPALKYGNPYEKEVQRKEQPPAIPPRSRTPPDHPAATTSHETGERLDINVQADRVVISSVPAAVLSTPLKPLPAPLQPEVLPSARLARVKAINNNNGPALDSNANSTTPTEEADLPELLAAAAATSGKPAPVEPEERDTEEGEGESTEMKTAASSNDVTIDMGDGIDGEEDRFEDAQGEPQKICPVCNAVFTADTASVIFMDHIDSHYGPECPICNKTYPQGYPQDDFQRHVDEHFTEDE